ncbi:MAG TPA: hypothetical protein VIT65_23985 [Microlunatus sp.]
MTEDEMLEAELIRAGRTLRIEPVPDDLAAEVLAAVAPATPAQAVGGARRRSPGWWRWLRARRRRLAAAVLIAVLLLSALTPQVRAAVSQWLRIGGVMIRTGAPPPPSTDPRAGVPSASPLSGREVTVEEAQTAVDFSVGVPSALGEPDRVTVSDDGRVVGMDWTTAGRSVHLDQFDGTMSWVFLKQNWSHVTPTEVDGTDAAWLADPHEIAYVDRAGVERRETARVSGPCLVWQPMLAEPRTTARLEGVLRLQDARVIAESLR